MCLGIPMQVIEARDGIAVCEGLGERREINMQLVGEQRPGTWVLAFLESCLWWYYGAFYEDRPILVFAVLAATGALLMLGRYLGTRHRWLTPSKA